MAGRGPAPKDPARRVGHSKDPNPTTTLQFVRAEQPPLPDSIPWCARTREWWAMWAESPQAEHFMACDWDFLLDTALMHQAYWGDGDFKYGAELRLRVAKYGATPEDRARLRMHFADADEKDAKRRPVPQTSRERYAGLKAVPSA